MFRGFSRIAGRPIDANGEHPVAGTGPVWFRNGGCAHSAAQPARTGINRKFTPNRMIRILCKFSAI
jgi:hypothetical protein